MDLNENNNRRYISVQSLLSIQRQGRVKRVEKEKDKEVNVQIDFDLINPQNHFASEEDIREFIKFIGNEIIVEAVNRYTKCGIKINEVRFKKKNKMNESRTIVKRYHDYCIGHTVTGHEGKCRHLHGHNYRITFFVTAKETDDVGRIVDFSVIKEKLCLELERAWDHKFLIWGYDDRFQALKAIDPFGIVAVPFNPTAENMAEYLVNTFGPAHLPIGLTLCKVEIEETRKCSASYEI